MHLKRGSLLVRVGDRVEEGQQLAECGNSGNSTQPHLHIQVTDDPEMPDGSGMPMAFRHPRTLEPWMPGENEVFRV